MRTPDWWETFTVKNAALYPLSLLYALGVRLDRETTQPRRAVIPVVSVGNITAGGTGKTPVTLTLVAMLKALGHTPHILTRGYGAHAKETPHSVQPGDDAALVGDEALLLTHAAPTWVGADRLASSRRAAAQGASIALCDDAHQHYRLVKTLSFVVVDGPFGFGNGMLIPAGPLREPVAQGLQRADAVIVIGEDAQGIAGRVNGLPVFHAQLKPTLGADAFAAGAYMAFAGIGRPQKFFTSLQQAGVPVVVTRAFADHHAYMVEEILALKQEAAGRGAVLITTEKDVVKIPEALREGIAVFPVALVFDAPEAVMDFLRAGLT